DYNFVLTYKPRTQMTKADLLLRQVGYEREENDNKNLVLLDNSCFVSKTI
ncbi:uncharacterized protein FOMMEDRAFT_100137, partial [Fomitiporia mediterranea MF3/22]